MPDTPPDFRRGDVWYATLDPVVGHEQAGLRPVIIVSNDLFNESQARLVAVVPLTSRLRPIVSHVRVDPPEGGLRAPSDVLCEQLRFVSVERLKERRGKVSDATLAAIAIRLRRLLQL